MEPTWIIQDNLPCQDLELSHTCKHLFATYGNIFIGSRAVQLRSKWWEAGGGIFLPTTGGNSENGKDRFCTYFGDTSSVRHRFQAVFQSGSSKTPSISYITVPWWQIIIFKKWKQQSLNGTQTEENWDFMCVCVYVYLKHIYSTHICMYISV